MQGLARHPIAEGPPGPSCRSKRSHHPPAPRARPGRTSPRRSCRCCRSSRWRCRPCRRRARRWTARLGRGRRRLRHRRRLRRSSQLRDGDPRPRAGGGRLPRRRSSASPTGGSCEPWRQFGRPRLFFGVSAGNMDSHDQPLHGQQEGPQRRRLLARRPDRPAARPRDAALLPAGPRGLSRRAGDRRRRRGVAAAAGPLRLLERHGPPVDPARLQGRPASSTAWASRRSSRSPGGWPPARRSSDLRDMRGVAYVLGAEARQPPAERAIVLPSLRGGQGRQARVRRGDADHPQRHQPAQRQDAGAVPRPPGRRRQPARRCRSARRRWTASTTCPTRAGRTRCTPSRSPRSR